MVHHNLCLDENSMGISTGYKQGVSRGWQLVSDTAVSSHPWTVSDSKGWHDTGYVCHQSPIASRNWASFFILKTVKEAGSACQSCSWWQSTSHMLDGLWVPPPSSHLHVFVIERTKEPASKIFINQVKNDTNSGHSAWELKIYVQLPSLCLYAVKEGSDQV